MKILPWVAAAVAFLVVLQALIVGDWQSKDLLWIVFGCLFIIWGLQARKPRSANTAQSDVESPQ